MEPDKHVTRVNGKRHHNDRRVLTEAGDPYQQVSVIELRRCRAIEQLERALIPSNVMCRCSPWADREASAWRRRRELFRRCSTSPTGLRHCQSRKLMRKPARTTEIIAPENGARAQSHARSGGSRLARLARSGRHHDGGDVYREALPPEAPATGRRWQYRGPAADEAEGRALVL